MERASKAVVKAANVEISLDPLVGLGSIFAQGWLLDIFYSRAFETAHAGPDIGYWQFVFLVWIMRFIVSEGVGTALRRNKR